MITKNITYQAAGRTCVGYVAYEDTTNNKPVVIVVPAFEGCSELYKEFANKLAALGYIGFTVDLYGEGQTFTEFDDCLSHALELFNNRALVRQMMLDIFEVAKSLDQADQNSIASIGFCLGGLCSLDLARSGANVKGVASFHGNLTPPGDDIKNEKIKAQMLVMTGYDDPQVPPEQVQAFCQEMKTDDFQLIVYSNTQHAFTNPNIGSIAEGHPGAEYQATTAQRAWQACTQFLNDLFK